MSRNFRGSICQAETVTFRLPSDSNRLSIVGMTGSGKTVAGLWHLSRRDINKMPWVIVDFKRDSTIAGIPRLEEVDYRRAPPKKPGLYVVRPFPDDAEEVDEYLWKIWAQEHTGLFVDEGYMIDRFSKPLRAILTQGRSKRVPVISLSQRPSWICPFLLSESEFLQIFYMHNPADVKKMREWVPFRGDLPQRHHSIYYDISKQTMTRLLPVPPEDVLLQRFEDKMPRRRAWL